MHEVPFSPQALCNEPGAKSPVGGDDLAHVQARARRLLDELNAFDGESQRGSHRTFVLCSTAIGLLAVAAGLLAWLGPGPNRLQWHWLPMFGGVGVLGLAVFSMVRGGAGLHAPKVAAVLILALFIAALRLNGAAPLLFMAAVVIFIHLVVPPKEALLACLVALTAALLVAPAADPQMHSIFLPRAVAASGFALLVMQLLVRRNLAFRRITRRVSAGLGDMVQALASDVSAAREARDLAERALAAQREADTRLDVYTRLTTEALQCMTQGLVVIDPQGRIQLHNERVCQLLDLPAELMNSKPLLSEVVVFQARRGDFGPDHDLVQSSARSYVTSLGLNPQVLAPPKYVRKTPNGRFLEIASHRTPSGYLVRTYTDVTAYQRVSEQMTFALSDRELQLTEARKARQAAEEALQAQQQAEAERDEAGRVLVSVVQASPHGLLVVGSDGRVLVFNDKLCDMLQMPRALLEGQPHYRELLALQAQRQDHDPALFDRPEYRADDVHHALEEWSRLGSDVYTRRSPDGRHLEVRSQFIASGYLVRTYADVSRYVEASFRLQELVGERDAQLQAAHLAREQAARALQDTVEAQTDRDRASHMLMASLKTTSHGILASDADGRISVWNERALELLELPESLLQDRPWFSTIVRFQLVRGDFQDDAAVIKNYLEQVLLPEEAGVDVQGQAVLPEEAMLEPAALPALHRLVFRAETGPVPEGSQPDYLAGLPVRSWSTDSSREPSRYTRKVRNGRFLEVTTLPIPLGGVIRTYSDVTEYVQANQKLEASLEQLHLAELQLKAELGRSREAMDLQARFVASVSHEIRTPLNGIAGMAELLAQAPLTAEQQQQLDDLRASTRQLHRLTDDILDLARVRDPTFGLDARTFNVWQLVRSCAGAAKVVARRKDLIVDLELVGPDCVAIGDPDRFAQILNNLLINAVKFTRRGFVRVTGAWELSDIDPERMDVHVSVADSGRGIDPALIAVIFEPFHQGEESINRNFGGTGLGLTLCRELCAAMDGQIQVTSRPHHGSVFSFSVCLQRAAGEQGEMHTQPSDLTEAACLLDGVRVLAVDDNRINQKLLQTWLGQAGAEVVLAFDGEEGVRLASSETFDCVLMDLSMPVMNGLQATQVIRCLDNSADTAQVVRAWVPIVGVTAMARKEDRQLCLDAGMNGHLAKPLDRAELLRTVRRLADYAAWLKTAGDLYGNPGSPDPLQQADEWPDRPAPEAGT